MSPLGGLLREWRRARDVTLDEVHIECCFPVDEATAALCRRLARDDVGP